MVSSWLGTEDIFLALGILCQSISHRAGGNRVKFLTRRSFFDNSMRTGVEEDAARSCNPSVNSFNRSNMVSSTSFSRSKFPLAVEKSMECTAFCLVTATERRKNRCCNRLLSYLLDNLGVSPVGHEKEQPSSSQSLPNSSTDGEPFTTCTQR